MLVNPNEQGLDALWRDAKRYQFLRDLPDKECGQPGMPCIAMAGFPSDPEARSMALNGKDADAAVDEAMERKRRIESARIYKIAEEPKSKGGGMNYDRIKEKRSAVKKAETKNLVADSTDVRLALIARVDSGEITLEQAQAELKKIKASAKRNGQATRSQVWARS